MKLIRKSWDAAIHIDLKLIVIHRRTAPDGNEKKVRFAFGKRFYPWKEMEVGDFFVVAKSGFPLAMRTAFLQAAARHDIEISIQNHATPKGEDGFRVIKVLEGIKGLKRRASLKTGKVIPASDGKWAKRRHQRQLEKADIETPAPSPRVLTPTTPTEPIVRVHASVTASDVGYDRAARLRAVREAAREALGLDEDETDYIDELTGGAE